MFHLFIFSTVLLKVIKNQNRFSIYDDQVKIVYKKKGYWLIFKQNRRYFTLYNMFILFFYKHIIILSFTLLTENISTIIIHFYDFIYTIV